MALKDDLVLHIKALAGQSAPTDILTGDLVGEGSGVRTLRNDVNGDYWRITGGSATATLGAPRLTFNNWDNNGVYETLVVFQFRISSRQANYTRHFVIGDGTDTGFYISNVGASGGNLRNGCYLTSTATGANNITYSAGTLITVVQRFYMDTVPGNTSSNRTWIGGLTHVAGVADVTNSGSYNRQLKQLKTVQFNTAGETLDVYRVAVLAGSHVSALSNDDCAALADNPALYLDASADPTEHFVTIANSQQVNHASSISAGQGTPPTYVSIANSQQVSHAASITVLSTTPGSITIPAIRDWETNNLKLGQTNVQVDVYNPTTGALIKHLTGQTTHATTGVCVVSDPLFVSGTTYAVVTRFADGSLGIWDYPAS